MPVDTSSKEYLDFAKIKADASVKVILASLGLLDNLTLKGEELVGECMLGDEPHGKSDSFAFNTRKKTFQCFACKQRGSVLDFVAKYAKDGCTLREGAEYVFTRMRHAYAIAGDDADESALVAVVASDKKSAQESEPRLVEEEKQSRVQEVEKAQTWEGSLSTTHMESAVMSWPLAKFRVEDGKLDPSDLVVVDVKTLEFLRQLTRY